MLRNVHWLTNRGYREAPASAALSMEGDTVLVLFTKGRVHLKLCFFFKRA